MPSMSSAPLDDEARAGLQKAARDHLWLHFTRMSSYDHADVPIIVRGEGPYIYDAQGKRYLDALAGLFVNQLGHGRTDLAEAAAKQASSSHSSPCGRTRTRWRSSSPSESPATPRAT